MYAAGCRSLSHGRHRHAWPPPRCSVVATVRTCPGPAHQVHCAPWRSATQKQGPRRRRPQPPRPVSGRPGPRHRGSFPGRVALSLLRSCSSATMTVLGTDPPLHSSARATSAWPRNPDRRTARYRRGDRCSSRRRSLTRPRQRPSLRPAGSLAACCGGRAGADPAPRPPAASSLNEGRTDSRCSHADPSPPCSVRPVQSPVGKKPGRAERLPDGVWGRARDRLQMPTWPVRSTVGRCFLRGTPSMRWASPSAAGHLPRMGAPSSQVSRRTSQGGDTR